jgi:hypothetical protein
VQRGRKSAAANVVTLTATSTGSRLTAPPILRDDERSLFTKLAALNKHLTATDAPMLACYVQAISKTQRLARTKDVSAWERAARVAMAMSRQLRMTASSATHPDKLSRARRDANPTLVEQILRETDDADDLDEATDE